MGQSVEIEKDGRQYRLVKATLSRIQVVVTFVLNSDSGTWNCRTCGSELTAEELYQLAIMTYRMNQKTRPSRWNEFKGWFKEWWFRRITRVLNRPIMTFPATEDMDMVPPAVVWTPFAGVVTNRYDPQITMTPIEQMQQINEDKEDA